jgi:parallel beta-helix repeat protein
MPAKLRLHAAPATSVSLAVILALAAAGLVASSSASTSRSRASGARRSAQAASPQPKCGDTITTDVTLHHNLVHCPNNGIIIGADNITLDLNYHTIDGDGTPAAGCDPDTEFCDTGVVSFRHDGVTVVHGSVRQFDVGVFVAKARHNRLLGLSSSRNRFTGFFVAKARHNRLLGVSAARNGFAGIFFFRCDRCLVQNSAGNRTKGSGDQVGMFLFRSHHDRILHSTFRGNVGNGTGGSGGGIASRGSTNAVIRGNLMSRNGEAGIIMEQSDGFRISHNRMVRNNDGILPGSDNVITRNHISRVNSGIRLDSGHGNLIAHNVVAHTHKAGIHLGHHGAAHNVVRNNLVKDSRKDGFLVGEKGRHNVLKGNVAKRSRDDGFDIESRSTKLTNNRAVRNNDLGIEAVPGVIDGGGNEASGNGDLRQCTNIVCS